MNYLLTQGGMAQTGSERKKGVGVQRCEICNTVVQFEKRKDIDGDLHIYQYCTNCKKGKYIKREERLLRLLENDPIRYSKRAFNRRQREKLRRDQPNLI